ncbi:MAG: hypothetical protein LAT51_10230 [Flavobacteriaceae bacterium]|nr:hypothetical protein [Flavobacteriaceae bacterium]
MFSYQIKTFRPEVTETKSKKPHFYVLNKGLNSGKPLKCACANCYIITANDQETLNRLYWLTYSLWKTDQYKPLLRGSVIPFITIGDINRVLNEAFLSCPDTKLQKVLEALKMVKKAEETYEAKIKLLNELKVSLLKELVMK